MFKLIALKNLKALRFCKKHVYAIDVYVKIFFEKYKNQRGLGWIL